MRTLILGLGNPVITDERLGLEVARGLHAVLRDPDVDIIETSVGGLNLLEIVAGYDKVVVVDCIRSGEGDIGELRRLGLEHIDLSPRRASGRGAEFRISLEPGEVAGAIVPREISIYAIEVEGASGFIVGTADRVSEVVPKLIAQIARDEFGARSVGGDWF